MGNVFLGTVANETIGTGKRISIIKQAANAGTTNTIRRKKAVEFSGVVMFIIAAPMAADFYIGSHSLDTLSWIIGSLPEEVFAYKTEGMLRSRGIDTVDGYQTLLRYRNGTIAQMENSWITPNGNSNVNDFKFDIVLEKGKFDIDASSHTLLQLTTEKTFYNPDVLVKNKVFNRHTGFAYESIRSFVDKMISGEEFYVTLREAANVTLAILAIMESAQTGKPVKTDLIEQ